MNRGASLRQQGRHNAPQTLRRTGDQRNLISKIRHRLTAAVYLIEIRNATIRQFASPFIGRAENFGNEVASNMTGRILSAGKLRMGWIAFG